MSEQDELIEQIGVFIEAYTGYGRDEGKRGWSADVQHTSMIVADVDSLIAEIIALVRADMARQLLSEADGYIVARGDDGEAQGAFATLPWMKKILAAIGITEGEVTA